MAWSPEVRVDQYFVVDSQQRRVQRFRRAPHRTGVPLGDRPCVSQRQPAASRQAVTDALVLASEARRRAIGVT